MRPRRVASPVEAATGVTAVRLCLAGSIAEECADALLAAGALAIDMAAADADSAGAGTLCAEPGVASAGWERVCLTAFFDDGADPQAALVRAGAAIGRRPGAYVRETLPGNDWVRRAQAQFQPIHASKRIWIVPSWCAPVDTAAISLRIDPGLAFGTGDHPTTRLCLRWLDERLVRGASMLDYGCGSGILAIAAATLGATAVTGVDIDAQALKASRSNARANGVNARFVRPRGLPGAAQFDVVIANILADSLEGLAPALARRVSAGGDIVLCGILEQQAADVAAAYSRWFNIGVWASEEGWVALAGSRGHDHA